MREEECEKEGVDDKMSKRQIEKDFSRLYIGQNQRLLVENYYKKKKKDLWILFFTGVVLLLMLTINEFQTMNLDEGSGIPRNGYPEGTKELELEVRQDSGEWQSIAVTLEEKEYTTQELEESCRRLEEALPELILNGNESVDQIQGDLDLMQEAEGYPFILRWKSSNPEVLDSLGKIDAKNVSDEGEAIELTVNLEYGEWEQEHRFFVRVLPPEAQNTLSFIGQISKEVQSREEASRQEELFYLPLTLEEEKLSWRYPMDKEVFFLAAFFPLILWLVWREKDKDVHKQAIKRREALQNRYPEFVTRLILLMEAGMTVKGALFRIVQDYQKKKEKEKRTEYLYEELQYICFQMHNGMGEVQGYELLGRRCELPAYRKLSTLLVQHTLKGASEILPTLRQESWKANEERKNQVKRKGEEAGTKLLFPMIIMLGIVMILIIVPASFSFQI